jgi:hypothetical protein
MSPTTSGSLTPRPGRTRNVVERLAWQIQRVKKRMAEIQARLTAAEAR